MENDTEFINLLHEAYQAKVWSEVVESFNNLPEGERDAILEEFAQLCEKYGEGSQELYNFFHKQSMRFSKMYYFVNTLGENDTDWDSALEELL
jgi:hypothetical protein